MSISDALRFTGLQLTSIITGVMAVVLGCVYFAPEEFIRRTTPPRGQVSIVMYVYQLGPFWPVLFIVMGVALILAVTSRRGVVAAHVLAMFGWMFYGSALLLGSLFSEPPTPVVTGAIAVGVAGIHFGLLQAHQDAGDASTRLGGLL